MGGIADEPQPKSYCALRAIGDPCRRALPEHRAGNPRACAGYCAQPPLSGALYCVGNLPAPQGDAASGTALPHLYRGTDRLLAAGSNGQILLRHLGGCHPLSVVRLLSPHAVYPAVRGVCGGVSGQAGELPAAPLDTVAVFSGRRPVPAGADQRPAPDGLHL